MKGLITTTQAVEKILEPFSPLQSEEISVENALNRVLRKPLVADRPFPPFDRVTMDGIAFRNAGFQGNPLLLHGLHPAGAPAPAPLPPSSCWQIMTGAVLPPDCDTIVPYEEVCLDETHATIDSQFTPVAGQFIHREGSDASKGKLLVESNTRLTPAHLGLAASVGATTLEVTKAPKVHLFSTGDELVPMNETPAPHQLRRSNGFTLQMALDTWGTSEIHLHHLPDDLTSTTQALKKALSECDVLILSGGISKGKKDFVRPALESLIGEPVLHGIAQRPGKPLAFWAGTPEHAAVFALPGNPNSTLTTFHRYLVPALDLLIGLPPREPLFLPLESPAPVHPKLTQLLPARLTPTGTLQLLLPQNSGDFLTPLSATHLVEIPPGESLDRALCFPM